MLLQNAPKGLLLSYRVKAHRSRSQNKTVVRSSLVFSLFGELVVACHIQHRGLRRPMGLTPSGPPLRVLTRLIARGAWPRQATESTARLTEPYGRYPSSSSLDPRAIANRRMIRAGKLLAEREGFEPSKGF